MCERIDILEDRVKMLEAYANNPAPPTDDEADPLAGMDDLPGAIVDVAKESWKYDKMLYGSCGWYAERSS